MNNIKIINKTLIFSHVTYNLKKKIFSTTKQNNSILISNYKYCIDRVKKNDYEHYLCGLVLPNKISRNAYFSIRAFNIEISIIKDIITNPNTGISRILWWKEVINNVYNNKPPDTPIAKVLTEAVITFKLTKGWFNKILDRRESDIMNDYFRNISEMENYAEDIFSSLLYLTLECINIKNIHADHAASHLGKAEGLITLLRSTPYYASKRKCYLPLELMAKNGVSQEELFRGKFSNGLAEVIFEIASTAKIQLDKARSLSSSIPKQAIPALLTSVLIEDFLTKLQKLNFNIFHPNLTKKNPFIPFKLWKYNFFNKF